MVRQGFEPPIDDVARGEWNLRVDDGFLDIALHQRSAAPATLSAIDVRRVE